MKAFCLVVVSTWESIWRRVCYSIDTRHDSCLRSEFVYSIQPFGPLLLHKSLFELFHWLAQDRSHQEYFLIMVYLARNSGRARMTL